MRKFAILLASSVALFSSPAQACSKVSPTSWLPGYSEKQTEERALKIWQDWDVISAYYEEKQLYEEAETIFLSRVAADVVPDPEIRAPYATAVEIEPVLAIKGELPTARSRLTTSLPTSCGTPTINGEGARAKVGELVVVFTGLKESDSRPHSDGIWSRNVATLRYIPLMDEIHKWLMQREDYFSYND